MEYVFDGPCSEEAVGPRLDALWDRFKFCQTELTPSHRCSVHVHINVQQLTEVQLFNFIILYLITEDALVNWCGERRVGNLFCLRARDAEFVIDSLEETSVDGLWPRLHTNDIRYAAMNCKALGDFGSLEFRSLRGVDDPAPIKAWVSMLLHLRDAALRYDFPNNILDGFSAGGEEAFCREVFGDHFEDLFWYEGWRDDVRSGMRRCQCIAYSGDWLALSNDELVPEAKKEKPLAPPPWEDFKPNVGVIRRNPAAEVQWVAVDGGRVVDARDPRVLMEAKRQVMLERERQLMERLHRNLRNEVDPDQV